MNLSNRWKELILISSLYVCRHTCICEHVHMCIHTEQNIYSDKGLLCLYCKFCLLLIWDFFFCGSWNKTKKHDFIIGRILLAASYQINSFIHLPNHLFIPSSYTLEVGKMYEPGSIQWLVIQDIFDVCHASSRWVPAQCIQSRVSFLPSRSKT